MTAEELRLRFAAVCRQPLPLPGQGDTAQRHLSLFNIAREDVSLAKLAEAHYDALAILAEAGRTPHPGALYGVWASEIPGQPLTVAAGHVSGEKAFCTGCGLIHRALVTTGGLSPTLLDLPVLPSPAVQPGPSNWHTEAFRHTNTGAVRFHALPLDPAAVIGEPGFYLQRPGFWHGAIGPAACWAGGAAGLLTFADASTRSDPHTLTHLAAMHANLWAMQSILATAGHEIDADPTNAPAAHQRALKVRFLIEQLASDTLHRFARAYGPLPLSMNAGTARRYVEVDLFLRQSHAERDLEALAHQIKARTAGPTQ